MAKGNEDPSPEWFQKKRLLDQANIPVYHGEDFRQRKAIKDVQFEIKSIIS
jgi:hypothetical protein